MDSYDKTQAEPAIAQIKFADGAVPLTEGRYGLHAQTVSIAGGYGEPAVVKGNSAGAGIGYLQHQRGYADYAAAYHPIFWMQRKICVDGIFQRVCQHYGELTLVHRQRIRQRYISLNADILTLRL